MMGKNLLQIFGIATFLAILCISCRPEDDITENTPLPIESANKFSIFTNKTDNSFFSKSDHSFDYSNAFAFMSHRYDSINGTNITGLVNTTNVVKHNIGKKQNYIVRNNEAYIDFRFHSEVIEYENGDIVVIYPKLNNGVVIDLVITVLSKNYTQLHYKKILQSDETFFDNIAAFQNYYDLNASGNMKPSSRKSSTFARDETETDIEGIVIIKKKKKPYETSGNGDGGEENNGGGCAVHNDCEEDGPSGGGGGGGDNGDETNNVVMPPPPDAPITDIAKFLSCLNITQPANLKVFTQNMQSSFPGHAFISITQGNNTMTVGFYPKNPFPSTLNGPSTFGDDSNHPYDNNWNAGQISSLQLQQIIAQTIAFSHSNYGLNNNNCSDYVNYVLQIAGINTTAGGVDTPNSITGLFPSGRNVSGNAPQSNRTCP